MDYEEFRLRIRSNRAGSCELTVEQSPYGGATISAWRSDDGSDLRRTLGHQLTREERPRELNGEEESADWHRGGRRPELDRARQREFGCFLFDLLFTGPVRDRLVKSLEAQHIHRATGRGATGLRLRLTFGAPGEPASANEVAHLAALPWELLYCAERGRHLSLDKETPVVRAVDAPGYRPPLVVDPPLVILVVSAQPRTRERLELREEIGKLQSHLADTSLVRMELLERASFERLCNALESDVIHALHYLGHSSVDHLVLEDSLGRPEEVGAAQLADLIRTKPSVRLAVLNSCNAGSLRIRDSWELFSGVAARLLLDGLPAVVAMQAAIGDDSAIRFADAFYRSLSENEPIEVAATRGRRGILAKSGGRGTADWATPVLYSNAGEGSLFELASVVEVLGIRFREAAGVYLAERPLSPEDWSRIEGVDIGSSGTGLRPVTTTIAAAEALFRRSRGRVQAANGRVAGFRLPAEMELRRAYEAGARGLGNGGLPYHYCTREDRSYPYGGMKGDAAADLVAFQQDGWNKEYSPHCVVLPVAEVRDGQADPANDRTEEEEA